MQKVIARGQPVEGPPGPIVVCTRNNDLQGVLDSAPEDRRAGSNTQHGSKTKLAVVGASTSLTYPEMYLIAPVLLQI